MRTRRGWLLAGVALLTACGDDTADGPTVAPVPTSAESATSGATAPVTTRDEATAPFVPTRLRISTLQMDAAIAEVGLLPDGKLDVPVDPLVIGWWGGGAHAGDALGGIILDGHVNTAADGIGHVARLREVEGRLVLITCGGPFDRRTRHYRDNVIVYASPVS